MDIVGTNYSYKGMRLCSRLVCCGLISSLLGACTPSATDSAQHAISIQEVLQLSPRDGDLICRLGSAWYSSYMSQLVSESKRFSHIGILVQSADNTGWFVFHAEEDSERGYNGVVLEPLEMFLSSAKSMGLYRLHLSAQEQQQMREQVDSLNTPALTFDASFGDSDTLTVYCTELVALILQRATGYQPQPTMTMPLGKAYSLDDVTLAIGAKEL